MRLNTLKPAAGAKKAAKRRGRGIGSGLGKTGGRGHKGQTSRSGYSAKVGFEGGQMPLHRRIPKSGFTSRKSLVTAEVPMYALSKVDAKVIDIAALRTANLITSKIKYAKVVLSGELVKAVTLSGIRATAGVRAAIEKAGGKVE